ncbi:hypothetical protein KC867_01905 [Candidatus Saccharibacteria bacterium]|nr:hypothetical protein [Candidatus Saccharibacteria bacterium]
MSYYDFTEPMPFSRTDIVTPKHEVRFGKIIQIFKHGNIVIQLYRPNGKELGSQTILSHKRDCQKLVPNKKTGVMRFMKSTAKRAPVLKVGMDVVCDIYRNPIHGVAGTELQAFVLLPSTMTIADAREKVQLVSD